jgi:hypothetical protein
MTLAEHFRERLGKGYDPCAGSALLARRLAFYRAVERAVPLRRAA